MFVTESDFHASTNPGFLVEGRRLLVRLDGAVREAAIGIRRAALPADIAMPARAVIQAVLRDHPYVLGGSA